MALLKAARVADVPTLDVIPKAPILALASAHIPHGDAVQRDARRFLVVGHRGKGMNLPASPDRRRRDLMENSILSFNSAAPFVDFVEFDVQVTKDDCPVIFHDDFILTEEDGNISEKRVTDLYLEEFRCYGLQKEHEKVGKPLLRKTNDGRIFNWHVESDAPLCTLQEAFESVDCRLGFNLELKFDDHIAYQDEHLTHILQVVLKTVYGYAKERPVIFSSFQPDAARLIRKLQNEYPVYFLTNGGTEIYTDVRRNSLDEAIKLCLANGLQGIVSDVRAIFRNPSAIPRTKEANLSLLSYGQLNNVPEAVYMQHLMGVNGVIVDLVQEIAEAISEFTVPDSEAGSELEKTAAKPNFSQRELSFLLRLIPELVQ